MAPLTAITATIKEEKMDFEDFDFGDLLGLGLAIGEEISEEEIERLRIERELDKDTDDDLLDY
jgi:hypothetical protein